MSKGPANGWCEVHETRWWWCEVMCPWEGRGSLCVTAVGCLSCQGCIPAWSVSYCYIVQVQSFPVIFGVTERTALVVQVRTVQHTSITHTHTHTYSITCVCVPRQLFALLVSSPSKGLSLPLVAAPLGGNTTSSAESIQRTAAVFEQ